MAKFSKRILLFLAASLGMAPAALAQQDTALYHLQGVEIFGKPAEVFAAGSRVSTLDSSYLQTYTSRSLAEALQARTPIYFKTYGASGISSASFRGTSAGHTAVLWNGLNITLPSLGQSDFATLPLSSVGEVAMQHGAAGATYGSGAIGGAILLNSPTYGRQGFRGDLQQEVGSFGRYFSNAAASYSNEKLAVGISGNWQLAPNRFPYRDYATFGAPERKQEHAEVQQHGFAQDLVWHLSPKSKLSLHSWYTSTDREVQPALGAAYTNAQQLDKNLRLMAGYDYSSRWGQTSIKTAWFSDYLKYTDDNNYSVTDIQTYQVQAEQTYTYGKRWSLRGGVNLQHFTGDVEGYGGGVTEDRAAAFALFRFDPTEALELSLNMRQAFIKNYNPAPTPTVGANWKLASGQNHHLYLKGNVSGSYRVPTLNERFWQPGGNSNLKPEQGWNYESGLRHVYTLGSLLVESEATAYYMLVDNWVQWVPTPEGFWTPHNLQKVRSQGLELSSQASRQLGDLKLTATAGYTYTSTEQVKAYEGTEELDRQLAYVPLHKATFFTDAAFRTWSLSGNLSYNGLRYTNGNNTNFLPSFTLVGFALNKQFLLGQQKLIASARVDNATNTDYKTMQNLPMPGRQYALSLRFIIP
ncbi:TonB-dependent receptor plug domain-containing protein [Pontibacter ruber]|uniref:TonB-dependent receptor plug domain-containing protein n=1 Tax=Pontibacter ruber TaxID=1343895 RepID=A0ABW5CYB7_9BACT|nr:TonB-dependent receptor [Pontibacter ruber]